MKHLVSSLICYFNYKYYWHCSW